MSYKEPRRLAAGLKGLLLCGLSFSTLGALALAVYFVMDPLRQEMGAFNGVSWLVLVGLFLPILNLILNLMAQILWMFWVRRLSLNVGLSGATAIAAFVVPIGNLWGPFRVMQRLTAQMGEAEGLRRWWLITLLAGIPILPLSIWLVGNMADSIGLTTPFTVVMLFGYASMVTALRDYLGWRLVKRLSVADSAAARTEMAVSAF
ncbi:hypothetical protein [Asticcacaulis sp. YBE204]|uniref:hypothetical protein n=1 Tax=Asticcacaulis sp. YBE204 TaxID=1282363 RepID=UPI0003C3DDD9|nr:hypothetical protein [Asticcacaulis sp. YBE204]ESQ81120.1 hypothetical protein AEYBE204_01960 [Asticcacaulis sp. YBE204]